MSPSDQLQHRVLLVLEAGSPKPVSESLLLRVVSDVELPTSVAMLFVKLREMESQGLVEQCKKSAWALVIPEPAACADVPELNAEEKLVCLVAGITHSEFSAASQGAKS